MASMFQGIRRHFDPRIEDDRGVARAVRARFQQGRGANRTRFDPMVHRFARTGFRQVAIWCVLLALGGVALLAGLVLLLMFWLSMRTMFPAFGYGLAGAGLVGLAAVIAVVTVPRQRRRERRRLAEAVVRFGVCPHCVYSLDGASEREDGCVLCPECGSAWRRDRIARFSEYPHEGKVERVGPKLRRAVAFLGGWRTTEDDRGRAVPLYSRTMLSLIDPEEADSERERAAEGLWDRLGEGGRGLRWLAAIAGGLAIFAVGIVGAFGQYFGTLDRELVWFELAMMGVHMLVFAALAVLAAAAIVWSDLGIPRHVVHRAMIEAGRCACCGSRLGEWMDEDGCATCEVCGAAWRMLSAQRKGGGV